VSSSVVPGPGASCGPGAAVGTVPVMAHTSSARCWDSVVGRDVRAERAERAERPYGGETVAPLSC
jgi:hypothetical protein